jgi:hypothetical protein
MKHKDERSSQPTSQQHKDIVIRDDSFPKVVVCSVNMNNVITKQVLLNKRILYIKYNNKRINIILNKKNKQYQTLLLSDKYRNNVVN